MAEGSVSMIIELSDSEEERGVCHAEPHQSMLSTLIGQPSLTAKPKRVLRLLESEESECDLSPRKKPSTEKPSAVKTASQSGEDDGSDVEFVGSSQTQECLVPPVSLRKASSSDCLAKGILATASLAGMPNSKWDGKDKALSDSSEDSFEKLMAESSRIAAAKKRLLSRHGTMQGSSHRHEAEVGKAMPIDASSTLRGLGGMNHRSQTDPGQQLHATPPLRRTISAEERGTESLSFETASKTLQKERDKEAHRLQKQQEKEALRLQRQREKDALRLSKQRQKEAQRKEKDDAKSRERKRRLLSQICTGKFACDEVAVLMEQSLLDSAKGRQLKDALAKGACAQKYKFHVGPGFVSPFRGVIRWAYRSKAFGGALAENSAVSLAMLPIVLLYWSADRLLLTMERKGYDGLRQCISLVRSEYGQQIRLLVVFEGVNDYVAQTSRERQMTSPNGVATRLLDFDDLCIDLELRDSCEVKVCSNFLEVVSYIGNITRAIAEHPHREALDSLATLKKSRSIREGADRDQRLRGPATADIWLRMLEMVPGLSSAKAQRVMDHYPTAHSLLSRYTSEIIPEENKENLLTDVLAASRREALQSRRVYLTLSGTEPQVAIE